MSTTSKQSTMKSKLVLIFTGVTLAAACLNPLGKEALAGGFSRSCGNIVLREGKILSAICKDRNANYRKTSLDLNERIGNKNGRLIISRNYIASCKNIGLGGGFSLRADCKTYNKDWRSTSLNLDGVITNEDGNLRFDR